MSRSVYSVSLWSQGTGPTIPVGISYTVPADHTLVLRDWEVVQHQSGEGGMQLEASAGLGIFIALTFLQPTGDEPASQWTGRIVLPAGSVVRTHNFGALTTDDTLSGYLLTA
jgi:hypothetical protein